MSRTKSPSAAGTLARTGPSGAATGVEPGAGEPAPADESSSVGPAKSDGSRLAGADGAVAPADTVGHARPLTQLPRRRSRRVGRTHQRARDAVLAALAAHQHELPGHSAEVAELAGRVARRLGLPPRGIEEVVQVAELHDVGKLALPEALLAAARPLDEREWALMRLHTLAGEQILTDLPGVTDVGRFVRSTHERWDGRGYPDGLTGEEIPLTSRIVFACDAYDAMTSERSYQRARTSAEALEELERCAGTQFDPRVVGALVDEVRPREATRGGGEAVAIRAP